MKDIKPVLTCPKRWKLLIPLNKIKLPALKSKKINLIIQIPKKAKAGPKKLNLKLISKHRKYDRNININIKKIMSLETGYIEVPRYVEKNFKVKFELTNKGNTVRKIKFFSNDLFNIKKKKIEIKPFENKLIEIKCRSNTPLENPVLSIKARAQNGKIINVVHEKIQVLNNNKFKIFKNHLKYIFRSNKGSYIKRNWFLKTEIKPDLSLNLSNNQLNLQQEQDSYHWQLGTDYNPRFKLAGTKTDQDHLKFSYLNHKDNNFKKALYTDFSKELGTVLNLKEKRINIYAEAKKRKEKSIDYYLKTHYKKDDNHLYLHAHKNAGNIFENIKYIKKLNKNSRFSLGYSRHFRPTSITKKKYFRYVYDKIKNKLSLEYRSIHNKNRVIKKYKISKIKSNIWNNFDQIVTLKVKDNSKNYRIEGLQYKLSNKNYRFLLKKQALNGQNKLFFKLTRIFKRNQINARISADNFGTDQINLTGELDYHFKTGPKISLSGKVIYNPTEKKIDKYIKMGLLIPFTLKLPERKSKEVKGRVITRQGERAKGVILSINGVKVKTDNKGKFNCYVKAKQDLLIKVLDLGEYSEQYVMSKDLPYFIENYNNAPLKLKLIKYGSLQIEIKKNEKSQNKYLKAIQSKEKGKVYVKLQNKYNYFIQKYKDHSSLKFDRIPPGRYKIMIKNNSNKYDYTLKRKVIRIQSGDNSLKIRQVRKNNLNLKLKEATEELQIKN